MPSVKGCYLAIKNQKNYCEMNNPFQTIEEYLSEIKGLLLDQNKSATNKQPLKPPPSFKFIPIQDIFNKKICSKPTFYDHLKKGDFTLYKFGSKSFVDAEEFESAFHAVKIKSKK